MTDKKSVTDFCHNIVEIMQEGLLVVGDDGTIQMVNSAMEEITGYTKEELQGEVCTIFKCDACKVLRPSSNEVWCLLFDRRELIKRKCHMVRKDGSYVTVLKTATVLYNEQNETVGAVEVVTDISEMDRLDRELRQLSRSLDKEPFFQGMIGHSRHMKQVFEMVEKAAQTEFPVLIQGESGTGKELVAQAIHKLSPRSEQPFIQVNSAALNESLLESELFGHAKGAFTGALQHRKGRFEAANGGDIFLDEIGDLPLSMQIKLLRVLETKTFERVGENQSVSVDVRIIVATNKDLSHLIAEEQFREDLYYRINVIRIQIPPLRERKEDIPHLVDFFLHNLSRKGPHDIKSVSREAMHILMNYSWPGNVRELKNTLEYSYVLTEGDTIRPEHLPEYLREYRSGQMGSRMAKATEGVGNHEKEELIRALRESGGNKAQAARILGINRVTVLNRMRKHGVDLQKDIVY